MKDKKIGKITVKHYLNTNLKAYIINGEKYYAVYMLITYNRKTTRIKSKTFTELYSEKMYNDIQKDDDVKDTNSLSCEAKVIETIIKSICQNTGEFDVLLLSLLLEYINDIKAPEITRQLEVYNYQTHKTKKVGGLWIKTEPLKIEQTPFEKRVNAFYENIKIKKDDIKNLSIYEFLVEIINVELSNNLFSSKDDCVTFFLKELYDNQLVKQKRDSSKKYSIFCNKYKYRNVFEKIDITETT